MSEMLHVVPEQKFSYQATVNQYVRDAYQAGARSGWYSGYTTGYDDGEGNDNYDPNQNPWEDGT
jgi:hypothetical protein